MLAGFNHRFQPGGGGVVKYEKLGGKYGDRKNYVMDEVAELLKIAMRKIRELQIEKGTYAGDGDVDSAVLGQVCAVQKVL